MALGTPVQLTTGATSTIATTYTDVTASITPTANALILVDIWASSNAGGTTTVVSVTGCGLTWVQDSTTAVSGGKRLRRWRSMGASPTTGPLSVTFSADQKQFIWHVVEISGCDISGTNGSGAFAQASVTPTPTSATSIDATISPTAANNAIVGVFEDDSGTTMNPDTGYTNLTKQTGLNQSFVQYDLTPSGEPQTTCGASSSGSGLKFCIASEIKAAATGIPAGVLAAILEDEGD